MKFAKVAEIHWSKRWTIVNRLYCPAVPLLARKWLTATGGFSLKSFTVWQQSPGSCVHAVPPLSPRSPSPCPHLFLQLYHLQPVTPQGLHIYSALPTFTHVNTLLCFTPLIQVFLVYFINQNHHSFQKGRGCFKASLHLSYSPGLLHLPKPKWHLGGQLPPAAPLWSVA